MARPKTGGQTATPLLGTARRGFISYAHEDLKMVDYLRRELDVLGAQNDITFWHDGHLRTGDVWDPAIQAAIEAADVFVLAVSTAWLASPYIQQYEWAPIQSRNGLICSAILKDCAWAKPLGKCQATPMRGRRLKPIDEWPRQHKGQHTAAQEIIAAVLAYRKANGEAVPANTPAIEQQQDFAAPVWIDERGKLALDPAGDDSDLTAAHDPAVRQLHAAVRGMARDLARKARKSGNWLAADQAPRFQKAVSDFLREVAPTPEATVARLGRLWPKYRALVDLGVTFPAMIAGADPALRGDIVETEQTLQRLTILAASLVRQYPTIRGFDIEARAADIGDQSPLPLLPQAQRLLATASKENILDPDDAEDLRGIGTLGQQGDARRSRHVVDGARNLVVKLSAIAAWVLMGGYPRGKADEALLRGALAVLDKAEADIIPLLNGFRPEYRDSVARLTLEARKPLDQSGFKKPGRRKAKRKATRLDDKDAFVIPVLVEIPKGSFLMGVPEAEDEREQHPKEFRWAGPQHHVEIPAPFLLGRFPVTKGQFAAFVEATGYETPDKTWTYEADDSGKWEYKERPGRNWRNPGFDQTDLDPVVCVSFDDALAYIKWLNDNTSGDFRLPSEAEWEYAARAGTTTSRYWGDGMEDAADYAWFDNKRTAPVGADRLPNAFGLSDMIGNVWEWCADHWHDSYKGAPDNGPVWAINDNAGRRVLRGGSWLSDPRVLRAGVRNHDVRGLRDVEVGFRLARTLSPPSS